MEQTKLSDKTGKIYLLANTDEIARGGEGRIMQLPSAPNEVIKHYHSGKQAISETHFSALQAIKKDEFVTPKKLLYQNGQIVGYLMDYVSSDYFSFANLFNKNFCTKHGIGHKIKVRIARKLSAAVQYVHEKNCIIGDLNPYNILCNNGGELKFIDTDSYESPARKHNGLVLEDIRDFQKNGIINAQSDYFALAVLIFYLFTYLHPFKGIHPQYRNLKDRMIHGLAVISEDKSIKIPNCYLPLNDFNLISQFKAIFIKGERFMLSLTGETLSAGRQNRQAAILKPVEEDRLIIRPFLHNEQIIDLQFNRRLGYVETDSHFIVYKTENNALPKQKKTLSKNECDKIFISESQILMVKNSDLFYLSDTGTAIPIKNFTLPPEYLSSQHNDILSIIADDIYYRLYINDISGNNMRIKREQVHARSFSDIGTLRQSLSGINRVFYNTGKDLATVKTMINPKAIVQKANIFFIQYTENQKVEQRFARAEALQFITANHLEDSFGEFAFKPTGKYHGLIFIPKSGEIIIKRTEDFARVSALKCRFITEQSRLFYTDSGLVASEDNELFLLNMK